MKKSKLLVLISMVTIFALMITACSKSSNETNQAATNVQSNKDQGSNEATIVEITDVHGTVTVPVNPKNVVALDNRTFETLADWGIKLAVVPKV